MTGLFYSVERPRMTSPDRKAGYCPYVTGTTDHRLRLSRRPDSDLHRRRDYRHPGRVSGAPRLPRATVGHPLRHQRQFLRGPALVLHRTSLGSESDCQAFVVARGRAEGLSPSSSASILVDPDVQILL